jgi:hypothetical protein
VNHKDNTQGRCEHQELAQAFWRLADDGNPHFPEEQSAGADESIHQGQEEE